MGGGAMWGGGTAGIFKSGTQSFLTLYCDRRVIGMLFLGFSAGLPLLLVFGSMSAWLRREEIGLTTIGFASLVAAPYAFKALWAPLVDHLRIPALTRLMGQRRSWMIAAQCGVIFALTAMALTGPSENLALFLCFALLTGISSATQDIAIDAYRIEKAPRDMQGAMSAIYVLGYRIGMSMAGGWAAFRIAGAYSWPIAYHVMAGFMLVGVAAAIAVREPDRSSADRDLPHRRPEGRAAFARLGGLPQAPRVALAWIFGAYAAPLREFFGRAGLTVALTVLAFVMLFRIGDLTLGAIATAFYIDIGFNEIQIGDYTKGYGLISVMVGAFIGGWLTARFGTVRILLLGAVLVAVTNLLFATLALSGPQTALLAAVIAADNLSAGIATAAFIAFLSGLTNTAFTATQYAVLSSIMLLLGKFIASFSGLVVDSFDYVTFFVYTACLGLPAILLIPVLARWDRAGRIAPPAAPGAQS